MTDLYRAVLDDLRVRVARLEAELEDRERRGTVDMSAWKELYEVKGRIAATELVLNVARGIEGL